MDRLQWITHKEKKIMYLNYSNLKSSRPEDFKSAMDTIKKARDLSAESKEKIRFLNDVTNASANTETINALKEFAAFTAANDKVEKECVVGLTSIQKVLLSGIKLFSSSKMEVFDDIEKAKDWLAS
jgi:hypothetical protein